MPPEVELELKRRWCDVLLEREELVERSWKQVTPAVAKKLDAGIATLHRRMATIAREFVDAGGTVFTVIFFGEMGAKGPDHVEVDEALAERFAADQVLPASESGGFYAYSTAAVADEVERFLRKRFRYLGFKREDLPPGELWLPGLNRVDKARAWLKKQGFRRRRSDLTRRTSARR